jgi:hypothetical protein
MSGKIGSEVAAAVVLSFAKAMASSDRLKSWRMTLMRPFQVIGAAVIGTS